MRPRKRLASCMATAAKVTTSAVRDIASARSANDTGDEDFCTVSARLRVTDAALVRLLSVSGARSDFILSSADGSTTVRVELAVASVPGAEVALGSTDVMLDWSRSTISRGGNRVTLTRTELRLLTALMESAPEAASRDQLMNRLWPSVPERDRQLDSALAVWICGLRRRFAAIGLPHAIRTVRRSGYCLCI